jgi:hypothetical protein
MTENFLEQHPLIFLALIVWTLIWKGLALWRSARLNDRWWFLAILIINTLGLLEIFYLFVFSKKKTKEYQKTQISSTSKE